MQNETPYQGCVQTEIEHGCHNDQVQDHPIEAELLLPQVCHQHPGQHKDGYGRGKLCGQGGRQIGQVLFVGKDLIQGKRLEGLNAVDDFD